MIKKLMVGAAIGALMVSGALAQAPNAPAGSNANPPAAKQAELKSGRADFVMSQKPDQWLASRFKGTDVLGADNQKIGDVSDILIDKSGKIEAYVVSVGGFLGMGAKDVALAPSSFEVVAGQNGGADRLKISLSKDELQQAQNFSPYVAPRTTTGAGPGGMRPGGANSMRPPSNYLPPVSPQQTGK